MGADSAAVRVDLSVVADEIAVLVRDDRRHILVGSDTGGVCRQFRKL